MTSVAFIQENYVLPLLRCALELVGGQIAVYQRFAGDSRLYATGNGMDVPSGFGQHAHLNGSFLYNAFVAGKQQSVLCDHLRESAYVQNDPDIGLHSLQSFIGTAVRNQDHVIGALGVYDKRKGRFSRDHADVLERLVPTLALTEAHLGVLEDLQHLTDCRHTIDNMLAKFAWPYDGGDEFLYACLESLGRAFHAQTVSLYQILAAPEEKGMRAGRGSPDSLRLFARWHRNTVSPMENDSEDVQALLRSVDLHKCLMSGKTHYRFDTGIIFVPVLSKERFGVCVLETKAERPSQTESALPVQKALVNIMGKWLEGRSLADRLYESEALNSQMIRLSPTAIYRIDLVNQRFLTVNEHMCRATGYSKKELLSMKPEALLTVESRKIFFKRLSDIASGKPVSDNIDFQIVTKNGKIEWGRFHIRHLKKHNNIVGANVVAHIITAQKDAQQELGRYRKKLEKLVEARTHALTTANLKLHKEIALHMETARALRLNSQRLKELNTAMRFLLDKRNEERVHTEENIRVNLRELIDPYLTRLEDSNLSKHQRQLVDLIRMNLNEVVGSSVPEFSSTFLFFTPNELQVVNLIRKGKTTKEMARLLNISSRTVEAYRNSIRKKLGLKNKKINLRTYLCSKR